MLFKKLYNFVLLIIIIFLLSVKSSFAENKLVMITADYCIYCQIWEKEIGEIYPKTDISKNFPLKKIELDEYSASDGLYDYETNITPTFVFLEKIRSWAHYWLHRCRNVLVASR